MKKALYILRLALLIALACSQPADAARAVNVAIATTNSLPPSTTLQLQITPSSLVAGGMTLTDQSPNANHLLAQSGHPYGTTANALNGFACATGIASPSTQLQSTSKIAWGVASTIFLVAKLPAMVAVPFQSAVTIAGNMFGIQTTNVAGGIIAEGGGGGAAWAEPGDATAFHVWTIQNNGNNADPSVTLWYDRHRLGNVGPASISFLTDYFQLFALPSTFDGTTGTICELEAYTAAVPLTDTQVRSAQEYLSTKYALNLLQPTFEVLVIGDSLSQAIVNLTMDQYLGQAIFSGSFPRTVFTSCAWGGKTIQTALTEQAICNAHRRGGTPWAALIFAGTNDLGTFGTAPATVYANEVSLINDQFTNGANQVGSITTLTRGGDFSGGVTTSSFEIAREGAGGLNPLRRAGYPSCCTKPVIIADAALNTSIGVANAWMNGALFEGTPGFTHLLTPGQMILYVSYVFALLTSLGAS